MHHRRSQTCPPVRTTPPPPAPPPKPASNADLETKTWKDGKGDDHALVMTDLGPKCLLKTMEMMLPEGAKQAPTMGQRGCTIDLGLGENFEMYVVSNKLGFKMTAKEDIKGVIRTVETRKDGWIVENDASRIGKPFFSGRRTFETGERTFFCFGNGATVEQVRGVLELCDTLVSKSP